MFVSFFFVFKKETFVVVQVSFLILFDAYVVISLQPLFHCQ